jgi:hypothetical protein
VLSVLGFSPAAAAERQLRDVQERIDRDEARSQERLTGLEAEAREMPVPSGSARRELAVADRVRAERRELAVTAARISPPPYITKELGERPADPNKRWHWDRGVADIEHYRQRCAPIRWAEPHVYAVCESR